MWQIWQIIVPYIACNYIKWSHTKYFTAEFVSYMHVQSFPSSKISAQLIFNTIWESHVPYLPHIFIYEKLNYVFSVNILACAILSLVWHDGKIIVILHLSSVLIFNTPLTLNAEQWVVNV